MYCIKETQIASISKMPEATLRERQRLYEEVLPDWEDRIFTVAARTFPKVDQGLMEPEDIQQEIRQAVWEATLVFDSSKGMTIRSWVYFIINRAASLIAKSQYHKMPHNTEGHGVQTLPLRAASSKRSSDDGEKDYEIQLVDPDSVGRIHRIELDLLIEECITSIRPAMNEGFEQDAFDLLITGMSVGETATELETLPSRVSLVRLKIKITHAILNDIDLEKVSSAKNVPVLATRIKALLGEEKRMSMCTPSLHTQPT